MDAQQLPTLPGVSGDALRAALARLGASAFRAGQEEAVRSVLARCDSLVLLPTGAGKSLCYTLPALLLGGLTVVVSPLKALMADQLGALSRRGIPSQALTSASSAQQRSALNDQLSGRTPLTLRLLFLAPEQLTVNAGLRASLAALSRAGSLTLVAVDEAHCIADWGSTFRSAYKRLSCLREELPATPIMALTASATRGTQETICASLRLRDPVFVRASFDRPNIRLEARYPDSMDASRDADMLALLLERPAADGLAEAAIVYCRSRDECSRLAKFLDRPQLRSAAFHGQMAEGKRAEVARLFGTGELRCVCATVAFGMGVDKADVRLVVHATPPFSLTAYMQEAGRAGRDGLPSRSVVYFSAKEEQIQASLCAKLGPIGAAIDPDNPAPAPADAAALAKAKRAAKAATAAFNAVRDAFRRPECRRKALLAHFGEALPPPPRERRAACCDACATPATVAQRCAALAAAAAHDDRWLSRIRQAMAPKSEIEIDLDGFAFGLPSPDASDDEPYDSDAEEQGQQAAAAQHAERVAAAAGGSLAAKLDALEKAESRLEKRSGGRAGLGAALFSHRPAAAAAAAGSRSALASATADDACRAAARARLTEAAGGDAAAAEVAEARVFGASRGVRSNYEARMNGALMEARRAAGQRGAPPAKRARVLGEGDVI